MLTAPEGHASTHARQRVQSASECSPSSGWRRLMSASQATAHSEQGVPLAVSRHLASSMTGLHVRLNRDARFMSPARGQIREHHLRKSTSSTTSMAGISTTDHVMSPAANSRHSKSTVANESPMGHTRQNTGKPNTAADSSAPPKT